MLIYKFLLFFINGINILNIFIILFNIKMRVIKTKKYLRQNKKKLTKRILKGGGDKEIKVLFNDRIKNTINFLEGENNRLQDNAYNIKDLKKVNDIFVNTPLKDLGSYSSSIINDKENRKMYNMFFLDYHGSYKDEKVADCPENVYICMFGFFDTYSYLIKRNMGGIINIYNFFKRMTEEKFELICKYKALLSSPEMESKFISDNKNLYIDCFTKASWIFPLQKYYDVSMSIGNKLRLTKSYKSSIINANIINEIINNDEKTSLSELIEKYNTDSRVNYIFFIDSCMGNKIITRDNVGKIPETLYINQSLNYAICKDIIGDIISKISDKTKFLCSSSITLYKHLTDVSDNFNKDIRITHENLQVIKKNDNFHPLIPKLVYLYNNLITINPVNIKQYFENNLNMLIFLISLSFNKLRKFLRKISSNNPELYPGLIEFLKESPQLKDIFTKYNERFESFIDKYKEYVNHNSKIFNNIKIYKYIYDFLELSTILKPEIVTPLTTQLQDTPLSTIFSLRNFKRENITTNSKKIYISGIEFHTPIISYNNVNNPFKDITHIYANNCYGSGDIFQFRYFENNKLEEMDIDDSTFRFNYNSADFKFFTLPKIINLFNITTPEKILRINNLIVKNNDSNITFENFKIVDLHFKEIYKYDKNITFTHNNIVESIRLSNINITKLAIDNVKTLEFAEDITIKTLNINKLKKLILDRANNLYNTIQSNPVCNTLQELTLKNIEIEEPRVMSDKFTGLIKLEIINSKLPNFFILNGINELTIINSTITDSNKKIYKIIKNDSINIKIKDSNTIFFNIFIDINIKNSLIIIENYNSNIKGPLSIPGEGSKGGCFSSGNKKYYSLSNNNTLKLLHKKKINGNVFYE